MTLLKFAQTIKGKYTKKNYYEDYTSCDFEIEGFLDGLIFCGMLTDGERKLVWEYLFPRGKNWTEKDMSLETAKQKINKINKDFKFKK